MCFIQKEILKEQTTFFGVLQDFQTVDGCNGKVLTTGNVFFFDPVLAFIWGLVIGIATVFLVFKHWTWKRN